MNNTSEPLVTQYKLEFGIAITAFVLFSAWLLYIHFGMGDFDATLGIRQLWGALYQVMALFGGLVGLLISRHWGGYKSLLGRAILLFSISLLLQSFGQSVNSYYNFFLNVEVPYPSLGDVGFFGSTIFYILGIAHLAKLSGFRFTSRSTRGKVLAIVLPLVMLIFSYWFFLQGYEFDWTDKIRIFLDFGYPLGDALYVSIALLTFILCRNVLGGIMRRPVFLLVCALTFQYLVDFMFLYQVSQGTWYVGGINDYLYFASYFVMTMALIYMGVMFHKVEES